MWASFDAVGGFNKDRIPDFDPQDSLNWFVISNSQGKEKLALCGTPGIHLADTTQDTFNIRAQFTYQDKMYVCAGNKVYKYTDTGTLSKAAIGELATFNGYVSIASNTAGQLIFVDGLDGYIYDTVTSSFSQITSPYFPVKPLNVVFLDSYFVIPWGDSTQFSISSPNDGLTWDAFDTAPIQAYSGNLVGVGVVNRRLFFFKTDSTEVWYNTGAADFPFRRDNNLIFNFGCISTSSIQSEHGYLFWLARDKDGIGSVMMTNGDQPTIISTEAVENQIRKFTAPADLRSFVYKDDSHIFYMMNWTTDDFTFGFDVVTSAQIGKEYAWHRRGIIPHKAITGQPNSAKTRNIANSHAFLNGKHYVGSYKEAKIYEQSLEFGDNYGEPILRERTFRHISQDNYRLQQLDGVQIDITNSPATVGDYPDPAILLSVSRDGGTIFGNFRPAHMKKLGVYSVRTIWRLLGTSRDFVLKVRTSTTAKSIYMLGGAIDLKVLNL
jgi:hypothetical protein